MPSIGGYISPSASSSIVYASGGINSGLASIISGMLASGSVYQFSLGSGAVNSGQLASGTIATYARAFYDDSWTTAEIVSGLPRAVCFVSGGNVAMAQAGSGLRQPAIGVNATNAVSGAAITVVYAGPMNTTLSGFATLWSGLVGNPLYVGSGGVIVASGLMASGANWQRIGVALSGGLVVGPQIIVQSGPGGTIV